jgi:hypothetical protein
MLVLMQALLLWCFQKWVSSQFSNYELPYTVKGLKEEAIE